MLKCVKYLAMSEKVRIFVLRKKEEKYIIT